MVLACDVGMCASLVGVSSSSLLLDVKRKEDVFGCGSWHVMSFPRKEGDTE